MNSKQFKSNLDKVQSITSKIVTLQKERDNILLTTTSMFTKGKEVTYMDKNNAQQKGKVLYCIGQKSLTVITPGNEKINVSLDKIVLA